MIHNWSLELFFPELDSTSTSLDTTYRQLANNRKTPRYRLNLHEISYRSSTGACIK